MSYRAADATSHLFFAYLRSLSPNSVGGVNGVSTLPLSLQSLVKETRYPPDRIPFHDSSKVVMVVDSISPTPFALLRRAKNFEYRDDDRVLQAFSGYEDPVQALSDECKRVLKSISSTNESNAATTKASTSLGDASWSRFQDMGFGTISEFDEDAETSMGHSRKPTQTLQSRAHAPTTDGGRPTTPSWADFLSSGFAEQDSASGQRALILPPDKVLPPIDLDARGKSSQSHVRKAAREDLEPGELASINSLQLDEAFWWTWITSLAGEETLQRKAVFGRCALIETTFGGAWLVIEEMVKGAAPEPEVGAYIAEKKSRFTFGRKRNPSRTKSLGRKTQPPNFDSLSRTSQASPVSKTSIAPDQHARIQAAAAALQEKQAQQAQAAISTSPRRARAGDGMDTKTNSVFTLQPNIISEAGPAMKWATSYDKSTVRSAYLGNNLAGKGSTTNLDTLPTSGPNGSVSPQPPAPIAKDTPPQDYGFPNGVPKAANVPLPAQTPGEFSQAPSQPPPPVPSGGHSLLPTSQTAYQTQAAATDAAHVPLPAADGEGLERTQTVTNDQQQGVDPDSSPDGKKGAKKLKKKEGRNFKGLFKKKGPAPAPIGGQSDPLAAAAARAALVPKAQPQSPKQGSPSLTRRLSRIGRKEVPASPAPPVPATEIEDHSKDLQPPTAPFNGEYDSQLSLSRVDSNEQRHADNEFPKFDQGPLTEQPAFVPHEHTDNERVPTAATETSTASRASTAEPLGAHYDPPITKGGEYEPSVSPRASEEEVRPDAAEDRWAQIKKNAAERAKKQNEEQATAGRKSVETNGDGDESGEESKSSIPGGPCVRKLTFYAAIESRVARIKARVAELTGNMQTGQESAKV